MGKRKSRGPFKFNFLQTCAWAEGVRACVRACEALKCVRVFCPAAGVRSSVQQLSRVRGCNQRKMGPRTMRCLWEGVWLLYSWTVSRFDPHSSTISHLNIDGNMKRAFLNWWAAELLIQRIPDTPVADSYSL